MTLPKKQKDPWNKNDISSSQPLSPISTFDFVFNKIQLLLFFSVCIFYSSVNEIIYLVKFLFVSVASLFEKKHKLRSQSQLLSTHCCFFSKFNRLIKYDVLLSVYTLLDYYFARKIRLMCLCIWLKIMSKYYACIINTVYY